MSDLPRLSRTALRVLRLLAANTTMYGAEISRKLDVPSGYLYPLLIRLENAGWLTSTWEDIDPSVAGRPRTHVYTMTEYGRASAAVALDLT